MQSIIILVRWILGEIGTGHTSEILIFENAHFFKSRDDVFLNVFIFFYVHYLSNNSRL